MFYLGVLWESYCYSKIKSTVSYTKMFSDAICKKVIKTMTKLVSYFTIFLFFGGVEILRPHLTTIWEKKLYTKNII